jgi:hypothetical protein
MVANAQKLADIRGDMIGLNDIENPFTAWLETLKQMALELAKLANIRPPSASAMGGPTAEPLYKYNTLSQQDVPGDTFRSPMGYGGGQFDMNLIPSTPAYQYNSLAQSAMINPSSSMNTSPNVTIQINPAVAGLIDVIQNQSASGISTTVDRINSSYIA